jgi:hypothetical protein
MTAEEIRNDSARRYVANNETTQPYHVEQFRARMIQEIAAQLADLVAEVREVKDSMLRADEKIFGVKK